MNLITPWPLMQKMDIVFMRNVLIYFDIDTKREILGKTRQVLKPDSYLFLGSAETTLNIDQSFQRAVYDKAVCYRLQS
jgi:chemotaxis protein methyltransferase CheR